MPIVPLEERVSKRLMHFDHAPERMNEVSQDLESSIASLKKQDSYDNMRQTLSKMHLSVNYFYKEMPVRESIF